MDRRLMFLLVIAAFFLGNTNTLTQEESVKIVVFAGDIQAAMGSEPDALLVTNKADLVEFQQELVTASQTTILLFEGDMNELVDTLAVENAPHMNPETSQFFFNIPIQSSLRFGL